MRDGQPVQGPERGATSLRFVGFAGVFDCLLGYQRDDRIYLGIDALDLLEVRIQLSRALSFLRRIRSAISVAVRKQMSESFAASN